MGVQNWSGPRFIRLKISEFVIFVVNYTKHIFKIHFMKLNSITYGISLFTIIKSIKINYFYAENNISLSCNFLNWWKQ